MQAAEHIVILTGAGISAESGLGTFREQGGIWTEYNLDEVATPEGFARDPAKVHAFYAARRANCLAAAPNPAHVALTRLQNNFTGQVTLITQNVDDLHERAGSRDVIHLHGALAGALCGGCGHRWPAPQEMAVRDLCPACSAMQTRPDVVWFGEMPHHLDLIYNALAQADIFVAIGTSGNVYPAAGFVAEARQGGAYTLELNLEPSEVVSGFDEARFGPASKLVPVWVDHMLERV